jgi:GNAT superfamily N-acetyltransferase
VWLLISKYEVSTAQWLRLFTAEKVIGIDPDWYGACNEGGAALGGRTATADRTQTWMMADTVVLPVTWHSPSLRPDCVREVEGWLRQSGTPLDLRNEYPHAFHPEGHGEVASVVSDQGMLCHALVREVTLVTRAGAAAYTLVGSVITHPEQRRRGLATQLLKNIVQRARERGQDAVCLWSSTWGFYERLGFIPAGEQCELVLGPARGSLAPGIRPAETRDILALWDLHTHKPLRVDRTLTDVALLLSIPHMRVLVLERHGRAAAYVCYGKGTDFAHWFHEQGGSDEDVATLIRGAMDVMGADECTVLLPPYRTTLRAMLRSMHRAARDGICALRYPLTELGRAEFFIDGLDSV